MKRVASLATAILVVAVVTAPAARASAEDVATSIANEVSSPFCPGVTLESCPSDAAAALRAKIAAYAEAGWSKDRIMAWLEDEYGSSIRALPPASGSGLWAWLAPALALLAGALLVAVLARRWTVARRGAQAAGGAELSSDMRARLDDELRALRRQT